MRRSNTDAKEGGRPKLKVNFHTLPQRFDHPQDDNNEGFPELGHSGKYILISFLLNLSYHSYAYKLLSKKYDC